MTLEEMSMIKTMTKSIWGVSVFSISLGLAVPLSTIPASASEAFGLMSTCEFVNPDRLQCNFPAANRTTQVQYVSMQCNSTGGQFSLNLFQFLAVPPNNTTFELAYQIPITNQTSLGVCRT